MLIEDKKHGEQLNSWLIYGNVLSTLEKKLKVLLYITDVEHKTTLELPYLRLVILQQPRTATKPTLYVSIELHT